MASGTKDNWQSAMAIGFRAAAIGQMTAVLGQALLAGLALSGDASALSAHMANGALGLVISLLQVLFAVPLRISNHLPRWALVASLGLLLSEGVQMASGRLHMFAVHLPLGLALFAGLVSVVFYVRAADAVTPSESGQLAVRSALVKLPAGGKS